MITDEQFKKLKVGEWFFAVTQKDNNPFEQPFIRKFQIIEFMEINGKMSAVTSKTDKIGRHWIFRPRTMHLTYEDALVEKKQVLEKIKKFEQEQEERNKIYFAEQEAREKQRQEEHDNQIRAEERKSVVGELKVDIRSLFDAYASSLLDYCIWSINAYTHKKLYNNFKRVIKNRLGKVLDLFDKRIDQIERGE